MGEIHSYGRLLKRFSWKRERSEAAECCDAALQAHTVLVEPVHDFMMQPSLGTTSPFDRDGQLTPADEAVYKIFIRSSLRAGDVLQKSFDSSAQAFHSANAGSVVFTRQALVYVFVSAPSPVVKVRFML